MVSKNLIGDKYDKYRRFTYLFPRETASNDEKSSFVRYLTFTPVELKTERRHQRQKVHT